MTTRRRKKYLANCSAKERYIREEIAMYKRSVKHWKHYLNVELPELLAKGEKPTLYDTPEEVRETIVHQTLEMKTYRHELNRLKGMDRVTVPRVEGKPAVAFCKCENVVGLREYETIWFDKELFCSNCGRRILWERLKK